MATTKTASIGASISRQASETGAEMSSEVGRMDKELRAFVKERPVLALLSALAAGYMLGRVLRRLA